MLLVSAIVALLFNIDFFFVIGFTKNVFFSLPCITLASSSDTIKDPNYKPCYVPGASGLPSLDNIPSVADLTASFAARKEERLKQEAEKKETERRVSTYSIGMDVIYSRIAATVACHNGHK